MPNNGTAAICKQNNGAAASYSSMECVNKHFRINFMYRIKNYDPFYPQKMGKSNYFSPKNVKFRYLRKNKGKGKWDPVA